MKKGIMSSLSLAVFLTLTLSLPISAAPASQRSEEPSSSQSNSQNTQPVSELRNQVQGAQNNRAAADISAKREQIEAKIAEKKAAITDKLEGKRADRCNEKQENINKILDNRVDAAQRHLETFTQIKERLVNFVDEKDIVIENENALENIMELEQVAAESIVSAGGSLDFVCTEADATQPGRIVLDHVIAQRQALQDYRDAIKDYAVSIKSAIATLEKVDESDTSITPESSTTIHEESN